MPATPTLRVWRHQWLRVIRYASGVEILLAVVAKGGVLIGMFLIGIVFLYLLPEVSGRMIGGEALSEILGDYVFPIMVGGLTVNMWISANESYNLFSYKFYPISLAKITVVVQLIRAVHVRYLSAALAAVIALVLVSQRLATIPLLIIGMIILLLDSFTILLKTLYPKYAWAFYLIIVLLFSLTLFDILGGHHLSGCAFDSWMRSADGASLLILLGITCTAVFVTHRRIRTLLRYGS